MKTVKSITHKKLGREKAHGQAFKEDGVIEIDERLKGLDHLDTVIHEIMHIQNKRWPEAKVIGHSNEMANLLWELGYRRVEL
jgi:hypothetical protein